MSLTGGQDFSPCQSHVYVSIGTLERTYYLKVPNVKPNGHWFIFKALRQKVLKVCRTRGPTASLKLLHKEYPTLHSLIILGPTLDI